MGLGERGRMPRPLSALFNLGRSYRVFSRLAFLSILLVGFVALQFALMPSWHVEEREINYYDVASRSSQLGGSIKSGVTSLLGVPVFDVSSGLGQRVPNAQGVSFSGWILWRALLDAKAIHMVSVVVSGLLVTLSALQLLGKGLRSNLLQLLLGFLCLHWNSLFALREFDYATLLSSFHASTCLILFIFRCEIACLSRKNQWHIDLLPIAFSISLSSAHYGFVIPAVLFTLLYAMFRLRNFLRGLAQLGILAWFALVPALLSVGVFLLEWPTFTRYASSSAVVTSLPPLQIGNFKHILKQIVSDDFLILRSIGGSPVNLDDIVTTGSAAVGTAFFISVVAARLMLSGSLRLNRELRDVFVAMMGLWCLATLFAGTIWLLADREPFETLISTYESLFHVPALVASVSGILLLDCLMSIRVTTESEVQRRRLRLASSLLVFVSLVAVIPPLFISNRDGLSRSTEETFDLDDLIARANLNGQLSKFSHRFLTLEEELYFFKDGAPATSEVFRDHGLFLVSLSSKLRPAGHASTSVVGVAPQRLDGECFTSGIQFLQVNLVVSSRERSKDCWENWVGGGLKPEVLGSQVLSNTGKRAMTVTRFHNLLEFWSNETDDPNSAVCDLLGDCLMSLGAVPKMSTPDFGLRVRPDKPGLSFNMPQVSKGSNLLLPLRWDSAVSLLDRSSGTQLATSKTDGLVAVPASVVESAGGREIEVHVTPDYYMWWIAITPWAWWLSIFLWLALQLRTSRSRRDT